MALSRQFAYDTHLPTKIDEMSVKIIDNAIRQTISNWTETSINVSRNVEWKIGTKMGHFISIIIDKPNFI